MMSFIFLISALLLGAAVVRRMNLTLLRFEAFGLSIATGLVLWTWISFLLALVTPYALSLPATILVAGGISLAMWHKSAHWQFEEIPGGLKATLAWSLFTAATFLLLLNLMVSHYLPSTLSGLYSANATWADLGLHMSLLSHFNAASHLPLDFPVAAGAKLTYPFMIDLLSAWFVRGGWSIQWALVIPSLLLVVAFLQLMLAFGIRLFGRLGGAIIGLSTLLLSGSATGFVVALNDRAASHQSWLKFLSMLPQDYTVLTSPNVQVASFVADIILPQRTFVMGLAAFAACIVLLIHQRLRPSASLAWFIGGFIGLLPLVHAHTFVVIVLIALSLAAHDIYKKTSGYNNWFKLLGTTALIALPQIIWQSLANGTGTGGHLALGWVISPGESFISFWINNYGLAGLLIVGLSLTLVISKTLRKYLVWYAPLVFVFIAANIYSLQPFPYDNLKLILYVYLMTFIGMGYGVIWLTKRFRMAILPVGLLLIVMSLSGSLAILREFQHQDNFASLDDIALAAWVTHNTTAEDVFLTTDKPNQPVATLGGRTIVMGYRGWLYNYHLDYEPRLSEVQNALNGRVGIQNIYHAQYLVVAAQESADWTVDRPVLDSRYISSYSNPSWTVYRLTDR